MFGLFDTNYTTKLDPPIDTVLTSMATFGPDSPEYSDLLTHLERLMKLQRGDASRHISADTMATVAANILGIVIIVAYEQKNVLTSKGLGFLLKPK